MNIQEVLDFANQNLVCNLATTEAGKPRVRGMMLWRADSTGFYFHTSNIKSLYKQIVENPFAEVSFVKPDPMAGVQLRVRGKVEIVDADKLKEQLLSERPFLRAMGESAGELVIFRITNGEAFFWTMAVNTKESEVERVQF